MQTKYKGVSSVVILFILFLCLVIERASVAGCLEPFADATVGGGTDYAPGSFLFGQVNTSGNVWFAVTNTPAPPATGFPRIVSGSLSYPGLPPSTGNSVFIPADAGVMGRMTLNFATTRGAVYFSFLLKVVDLTGVADTGTENNYFAGFGDTVGSQNAALVRTATKVFAKKSGNGFKLGVARNSNKPDNWVFDDTQRNTNEVLFVVGSYNYNDHTANLWIDPSASTFGSAKPPPPTLTARRGADLNQNGIRAFVLGCRTNAPPGCLVDELRIGKSWSFVTGGQDIDSQPGNPTKPVAKAMSRPPLDYHLYITNPAVAARRPNIIFILCDDLGYGDLGVLFQNGRRPGLPKEATPNLDAFAAEGMQLREHYCPAPICAPSRASLLLGVHQGHANVRDQQFDKALEDNHTLGTVMQAAGYATAAIGKWGLGGDDLGGTTPAEWPAYPTRRGFDYFFGYERHGDGHDHYPKEAPYSNHSKQCYDGTVNITAKLDKCYTTDLFTARAKKWITDQHATHPDQPFFLYLAFDTPHSVYELPTQAYPAGGGANGGLQWLGTPGHMINTASGTVDSFVYPEYASATYDDDHNPATPEVAWPEVFQRFASSVRRIDDAVGDVKKLLQDLGIETNTLVIFTSDNGPTIEDALHLKRRYAADFFDNFGPMDGIKRDSFEGGIHMPMLVRWPGKVPAGTTNYMPSQFQDWMPTFADLAGLPAPARTDGVSLVPSLTGQGTQRPGTVYVEYFDPSSMPNYVEFEPNHRNRKRNQMQVIGLNGYQGVRYDIVSQTDNFEIYDVIHDTKEATNLAARPGFAALQQQMKDRVLQLRRPDDSAPRPYDDELVPASGPVATTNGFLDYAIYEGVWPWVPDVDMLTNIATGRVAGLNPAIRPRDTNYAIAFSGYIRIPTNGNYTFYLNDDAGAVFRLHEAIVIDDDFSHADSEASGSILLKAGLHAFRLIYRHRSGTNILSLKYAGAGLPKQSVPLAAFYADCPGGLVQPSVNNYSTTTPSAKPALPDAPPRNIPAIAWGPGSSEAGKWACLVHAGAARVEVTGDWMPGAPPAGDTQWHPIACTFAKDGRTLRIGQLFEGNIDNVQVYNRVLDAAETAALFGGDPSVKDWRRRYFASTPDDWMTDEDGIGVGLWCQPARGGRPFLADSPAMQWMPQITVNHREIHFNRRMAGTPALDYQIQASPDLARWTPLAGAEISVHPSPDLPGFEEVVFRADMSMAGGKPLYARVQLQ